MNNFYHSESLLSNGDDWFSSSIKLLEFITSPWEFFWTFVLKLWNSMYWIVSLLNVSFVSAMDIVMEWILESKSKELVSSLEFESDSSNNCSVCSPTHWDASSSIEESWTNLSSFEVFFKSSFFHVPSDNFNNIIRFISDFNLMETIAIPIVSLGNISAVEVVLCVVVMPKVVGWINEWASNHSYQLNYIW